MNLKSVTKASVAIIYSPLTKKIFVGSSKGNSTFLTNNLNFPGAIIQSGIDDNFDYRKTNLSDQKIKDVYKGDAYARTVAAARGIYMETGLLVTADGYPKKQKIVHTKNDEKLNQLRSKIEHSSASFSTIFNSICLDVNSFLPFSRRLISVDEGVNYDVSVFLLSVNEQLIGNICDKNVGQFEWKSSDQFPGFSKLLEKALLLKENTFVLPQLLEHTTSILESEYNRDCKLRNLKTRQGFVSNHSAPSLSNSFEEDQSTDHAKISL
uniref:YqaJ domain-containing protein n=1 Tax=Rhabditophanes sp. KR3021 TaxID=114890 RepID=A0AC35UFW9_9BILA